MKEVILVYADYSLSTYEQSEMIELLKALFCNVETVITQQIKEVTKATFIGKGKVEEVRDAIQESTDAVVFAGELSASQINNLETALDIDVYTRSDIILEIFAQRASTKESKMQVNLAYYKQELPRIRIKELNGGRQHGGFINRGSGESEVEMEERVIRKRIQQIERELKQLSTVRSSQRKERESSTLPLLALVGYTNAGKSTIMNRVLEQNEKEDKKVFEEDMLFATLDTYVRRVTSPNGFHFLLSDTVGFVENLPKKLLQAFQTTLDEIQYADTLLHVIDRSNPNFDMQKKSTLDTLKTIGVEDIPTINIFNKCDLAHIDYPTTSKGGMNISAIEQASMDVLWDMIEEHLKSILVHSIFEIPYKDAKAMKDIHDYGTILSRSEEETYVRIEAYVSERLSSNYKEYIV